MAGDCDGVVVGDGTSIGVDTNDNGEQVVEYLGLWYSNSGSSDCAEWTGEGTKDDPICREHNGWCVPGVGCVRVRGAAPVQSIDDPTPAAVAASAAYQHTVAWTQECAGPVVLSGVYEAPIHLNLYQAAVAGLLSGATAQEYYQGFMSVWATLDGGTPFSLGGGLLFGMFGVASTSPPDVMAVAEMHQTWHDCVPNVAAGPHQLDISYAVIINAKDPSDPLLEFTTSANSWTTVEYPGKAVCCP